MRRADRLFEIIQTLRVSARPLTARTLSERLEVAPRTIYRDIAALQARRVPIDGAPGVGYVLRRGYDLPPLTFTVEEIEAIAVGVRMVRRLRDEALGRAAENVLSKLTVAVPEAMRCPLSMPPIWVSEGSAPRPAGVDPAVVRRAIRTERKLRITYVDEPGRRTERIIRPISMVYYVDVTLIAAWCEMREDFRHFRIERVESATLLEERFADAGKLFARWTAMREEEPRAAAPSE
jgi:predicted DNA-binding transcriptional regulator YafY